MNISVWSYPHLVEQAAAERQVDPRVRARVERGEQKDDDRHRANVSLCNNLYEISVRLCIIFFLFLRYL